MTVVYDMGDVKMPNGEEDNGDSTVTNVQIAQHNKNLCDQYLTHINKNRVEICRYTVCISF